MMRSRSKGCRGERELAEFLRNYGIEARRGQQYCGADGSPDVVADLPGVHLECKRAERILLYQWVDQAIRDAQPGELPLVAIRSNRRDWIAAVPLRALVPLLQEVHRLRSAVAGR